MEEWRMEELKTENGRNATRFITFTMPS